MKEPDCDMVTERGDIQEKVKRSHNTDFLCFYALLKRNRTLLLVSLFPV